MSGSVDCFWGPRRRSSAGVGSRSSRRLLACTRTRSPVGSWVGGRGGAGGPGAGTRWRAEEPGGVGSTIVVAAQGFRGSGDSRGPDVAGGLDDKVDAEPGRCVDQGFAQYLGGCALGVSRVNRVIPVAVERVAVQDP